MPQSIPKLKAYGVQTPYDLLWILPLKAQKIPKVAPFHEFHVGSLCLGHGEVQGVVARPNFRAKGKGRAMLYNITINIKDRYSDQVMSLVWFNCYSSVMNKLKNMKFMEFFGEVSMYGSRLQISNPETKSLDDVSESSIAPEDGYIIKYPTVNKVKSTEIKKLINRIPKALWDKIPDDLPKEIIQNRKLPELSKAFKTFHCKGIDPTKDNLEEAKKRLIYQEFLEDQIKFFMRRSNNKKIKAPIFELTENEKKKFTKLFPYTLTEDQSKVLVDIFSDLNSGKPMMRLIQGDVGCGKTTVAVLAALSCIKNSHQVALMCPTESLARQHYLTIKNLLENTPYKVELLIGSDGIKVKREKYARIASGEVHFVIGTHALIQEKVVFEKLGLAIVDEQHKFGVEQRIKLTKKGIGVHCLIMSATPIPRSLSLTQFGDLDISIIKAMPSGRKGIKTKIVLPSMLEKFLSFLKTRLDMGEQAYLVVPAIEENEEQDFQNLEVTFRRFQKLFPDIKIQALHGKLKSEEKDIALTEFTNGKTQLLISTSVVEVGIDVPNATVMGIINPERFGLSSLHQLRGRIGRGGKMGFCFLVMDKVRGPDSIERLKIIESSTDGFKIAEADLEFRGQGDLFGKDQSGSEQRKKVANILKDFPILDQARDDIEQLQVDRPALLHNMAQKFQQDEKILSTI